MKFQKSMKKKIGAILLAGAMALAAFPLTTLAAEGNQFLPPDFTKAEMEETIKEYVNYTQFTEFTSDAERADHFFEEVPPAADAFQVTKMKGNDQVYDQKYYQPENYQYVIPYDDFAAITAQYYKSVPDMTGVDLGILGEYHAELDSFVIPEAGIGDAPYLTELVGIQPVVGTETYVEIYAKVSNKTADQNPNMDNESEYTKCVLTVAQNGEDWKYISFQPVDQFPSLDYMPTSIAYDPETNIIITADESIVPEGTTMNSRQITEGNDYEMVKSAIDADHFTLYDISLMNNGEEIQPKGEVAIAAPLPEGYDPSRTKVYRIDSQGAATEVESVMIDVVEDFPFIGFDASHFSLYAIAETSETIKPNPDPVPEEKPEQPTGKPGTNTSNIPATGDHAPFVGVAMLLGGAILLTLGTRGKRIGNNTK